MVEVHSDRRAHPFSDAPSRYSCRTAKDCRPYRSSHAGCRFGRGESSWFLGCFRGLHWSGCVPVLRVRGCRFDLSPAFSNGRGVDVGMEKSLSNTSLIYINPNKSLNYLIPSTLPKNKEKAKKSYPIFFLLNFLTP